METEVQQTIVLSAGWNWVSLYIEVEDPEEMLMMLEEALGENGLTIVSIDDYTTYVDEWGDEGELEGLTNEQMYMIETSAACEVVLEGMPANPASYSITINPGWNWIGFPSSVGMTIDEAFSAFDPEEGDMIVSLADYTQFGDEEWGYEGDMDVLTPGQGYMYYSASATPKILAFSTGAKAKAALVGKLGE